MSKIRFDIITIFPEIFNSYFGESIIKRAREKKLADIHVHNLRAYTPNKHRKTDDKPYGGGAGMVMLAQPIIKAAEDIINKTKKNKRKKIIVFSAKGKQFNQKSAYDLSRKYDQIIMIAGRYEGIDERVVKILRAAEVSIGPYVLTDGEIPAMIVVSAVTRLLPGAIRLDSLQEESHWNLLLKKEKSGKQGEGLEYPHYTRPEILTHKGKKYKVPKILLSGDHEKIKKWRQEKSG